jgi:hypothetical protein
MKKVCLVIAICFLIFIKQAVPSPIYINLEPKIKGEINFEYILSSGENEKKLEQDELGVAILDEKYYGFSISWDKFDEDKPMAIIYDIDILNNNEIEMTVAIWKGFLEENREISRTKTTNLNGKKYEFEFAHKDHFHKLELLPIIIRASN